MSHENDRKDPSGLSRRGFLKGVGAGTVATGFVSATSTEADAAVRPAVVGPGEVEITLNINGEDKTLSVEPRVMLLDALRNRLDMTGSKKVCDRATCGACTVLLDDKPVYACSMLAIEAEGHKITTIEGLGTPEHMNEVQEAFVEHDAQQCGFCTPGFVVACTAFLDENPNPTLDEVRESLGGNLCRCGTYAGMIPAVLDAAQAMKGGA